MSALPPKADIRVRRSDVRFVPKADILRCSKKYLIGGSKKSVRHRNADCLGSLEVDEQVEPSRTARPDIDPSRQFEKCYPSRHPIFPLRSTEGFQQSHRKATCGPIRQFPCLSLLLCLSARWRLQP